MPLATSHLLVACLCLAGCSWGREPGGTGSTAEVDTASVYAGGTSCGSGATADLLLAAGDPDPSLTIRFAESSCYRDWWRFSAELQDQDVVPERIVLVPWDMGTCDWGGAFDLDPPEGDGAEWALSLEPEESDFGCDAAMTTVFELVAIDGDRAGAPRGGGVRGSATGGISECEDNYCELQAFVEGDEPASASAWVVDPFGGMGWGPFPMEIGCDGQRGCWSADTTFDLDAMGISDFHRAFVGAASFDGDGVVNGSFAL